MKSDRRVVFDEALQPARQAAFGPAEFVEQEGFMRASEILDLAAAAGIGPGITVLDLCCGVGGPGRSISRELGCTYLGVDLSPGAIGIARARAGNSPACRFQVMQVPPLPPGPFEVVLLLETMLAFPDKKRLLRDVAGALAPGGRFAFTLEEGQPLTEAERELMPDANTVWLTPLAEMLSDLDRAGLRMRRQRECGTSHLSIVDALIRAFESDAAAISAHIGRAALTELLIGHRRWNEWLRSGRVRKFAIVAEKT